MSWIEPLKWYIQQLSFATEQTIESAKGITWIELMLDFEMSTRVHLVGKRAQRGAANAFSGDKATVTQRAKSFAHASRRLMTICGSTPFKTSESQGTLAPFGARFLAGIPQRPYLINPKRVFLELANQALLYKSELGVNMDTSNHWKWEPRYRHLPKKAWNVIPNSLNVFPSPKRRVRGKKSQEQVALSNAS